MTRSLLLLSPLVLLAGAWFTSQLLHDAGPQAQASPSIRIVLADGALMLRRVSVDHRGILPLDEGTALVAGGAAIRHRSHLSGLVSSERGAWWTSSSTTRTQTTWTFSLLGLLIFSLPLAFLGLQQFRRAYRTYRAEKSQQCVKCGYSLIGNLSGQCPECGAPTTESVRPNQRLQLTGDARDVL